MFDNAVRQWAMHVRRWWIYYFNVVVLLLLLLVVAVAVAVAVANTYWNLFVCQCEIREMEILEDVIATTNKNKHLLTMCLPSNATMMVMV